MRYLLNLTLTVATLSLAAQSAPVINSFSPVTTYPLDTIVITGSGFSSTPASLQVWFGPVRGTIISSTSNLIEVVVPPEATVSNLEVINLTTKKTTKSNAKFAPYFSGATFDPTKFGAPLSITNTNELYDFCSCDFNTDGKPDVAASKFDNAGDLLILKNQTAAFGAIAFAQQVATIGFPTEQVTCGDLNGDGKPDLVASRSGGAASGPRHTVFFLTNTSAAGAISFSAPTSLFLDPTHYARYIFIRDLNIDGKPEIIISNSNSNEMYIFLNTSSGGNPTFNPTPTRLAIPGASNLYGLDVQDMNGDSKPELIVTQFNKNNIYILINESTNLIDFNATPFQQTTQAAFNKIVAADFNEDGEMDIVASNFFGNSVDIWFNTPGPTIGFTKVSKPTAIHPNGFDVADIDGDKDLDIVAGCDNQLTVLLNNGNTPTGTDFVTVDIAKPNVNRNVALVDFDSDGKPDIAHVNRTTTNVFSINFLANLNCFKPEILNDAPLSICVGQTIQLKTIPGINVNHDWKLGGASFKSGPDYFANITAPGTYTVTSSSGSCSNTTPAFVVNPDAGATVPAEPQITSNQPVCIGQTLTLTAGAVAGGTYTWTKPDGTTVTGQNVSIANSNINNAGEYSLVVSVGVCKSNEASKLVDITNLANFDVYSPSETNSACQGSSIALTVTDYPNINYQWMKNGTVEAGQTATSYNATTSGLYKNRVTHATIVGCTLDTREIDVKILSAPVAAFTLPTAACVNSSLNFASSSTTDPLGTVQCAWTFGDAAVSSNCTTTHTYTAAQTYSVGLTVSYLGVTGCTSNVSKSLIVSTAVQPSITPSLTQICAGETSILTVGGGTFSAFAWTPTATGNPLTVTVGGTYSVTTTDAKGCTATANIVIGTKPTPTVDLKADPENDTIVTSGKPVVLQVTSSDPTSTYVWVFSESLSSTSIANPVASPLSTTTYTVTVKTTSKCDVEKSITITVDGEVKIPNVFTPNGDLSNDTWRIPGAAQTMPNCKVSIYDGHGSRIVEEVDAGTLNWNGEYNGKPVPPGTYYYVISCMDTGTATTGHILVAR